MIESPANYTVNFSTLQSAQQLDITQIFYRLNHQAEDSAMMTIAYQFIQQQLELALSAQQIKLDQQFQPQKLSQLQIRKLQAFEQSLSAEQHQLFCLQQSAVVSLTEPSWLQQMFQMVSSQDPTAMYLMAFYLQLTASDSIHLKQAYQALLLSKGLKLPQIHSHYFCEQSEIVSEALCFAGLQLALKSFPRVLFAEILGFTLAYCQSESIPVICFPDLVSAPYFQFRQQRLSQQLPALIKCIESFIQHHPRQQDELWQRLQAGFYLYRYQLQTVIENIQFRLRNSISLQHQMLDLLQHKVSAALGHHHRIQLQGRELENWFAEMPDNAAEFLQALKQSEYVDCSHPLDSPLLKLFQFNGPMFGVMNKKELKILKNWLLSDSEAISATDSDIKPAPKNYQFYQVKVEKTLNFDAMNNRKLFYYLLNADLYPGVLHVAKKRVHRRLRNCRYLHTLPFKDYSHARFDGYIAQRYQSEMDAYHPLQGQAKVSRAAYIYALEQIAPMVLIDGCWLQNALSLEHINAEISRMLFSIYQDENGQGILQQNHSHIFHRLLLSEDIVLPEVCSQAFTRHARFINSAFDIPVFMLAISLHSEYFLPELLGLNMAIELNGLGSNYLQLVDEWNYWGIDSQIASLHVSIDNYASGHTDLAKKAIQLYLDQILNNSADQQLVNQHWQRIYYGYASLSSVGRVFKLSLPVNYMFDKCMTKLTG